MLTIYLAKGVRDKDEQAPEEKVDISNSFTPPLFSGSLIVSYDSLTEFRVYVTPNNSLFTS